MCNNDVGFVVRNCDEYKLMLLEPWCDTIYTDVPYDRYIQAEQKNTNYDLRSKFTLTDNVDVMIYEKNKFTEADLSLLYTLRFSIPLYEPGEYETGNMKIVINKKFN